MKKILTPLLVLSVLLLAACNYTSSRTNISSDIEEARAITDDFYKALMMKDYSKAESFFSPKVFEESPEAGAFLRDNGFNTGSLQSVEYKDGESRVETINGDTKSQYRLLYETQYENTKCEETITLERIDEEPIKILGYKVNIPEEFLKQQIQKNKDTIK